MNKKEFQKVVKKIREDWRAMTGNPRTEYPKAMMTGRQEKKRTATINDRGTGTSGAIRNA